MKRKSVWYEENKDIILDKYYCGNRIEDICVELNCNKSMIYRKFKEWNIERRKKICSSTRCNAKYYFDYQYFNEINNEHKAYWLGFMLADGFVNEREISFCLKDDDKYLVELFKQDLKAEHPIKYNQYNYPFLTIVSVDMCRTLYSYGFHNNKSYHVDIEKVVKNVPNELEHHFIRGMFDGDGCIKYYNYDYFKKPQYHFGYTGTMDVCNYIKDKLDIKTKLLFEGNVTYTARTRDPKLINKIFEYLYKDATIYMNRKYETFKQIQMMTFNDYNKAIS